MSEPFHIGEFIEEERRRLWRRGAGLGLQSLWENVAGEEIAANARVLYLRDGVMAVSCSSSGWICELRLSADRLVDGMNKAGPPETIRELRLVHCSQRGTKYSK